MHLAGLVESSMFGADIDGQPASIANTLPNWRAS